MPRAQEAHNSFRAFRPQLSRQEMYPGDGLQNFILRMHKFLAGKTHFYTLSAESMHISEAHKPIWIM